MRTTVRTLLGVAGYEYRMHLRRRVLWVLPALAVGLTAATGSFAFAPTRDPASIGRVVGAQAVSMNLLTLVVAGALMSDRWVRDRLVGVEELLETQPTASAVRLWGKYLGVTAATSTPLAVIWAVLAVRIGAHAGQWSVAGTAPAAFVAIVLPGLLFVAGFSIVVPRLLGARLYQVLFIGYWFWGNLVPAHLMPTLSATWLTPIGKYADAALFARSDHALLLSGGADPVGAWASIGLLAGLGLATITIFAVCSGRAAARLSPERPQP